MSGTWKCLQCSEVIERNTKRCPYCGTNQFGENNEYVPTARHYAMARKALYGAKPKKQRRKSLLRDPIYTDEARLTLGLYPKDEGYKMSLISKILGKR